MPTTRNRPRRRVARPLLIAVGALSLGAVVTGCDDAATPPGPADIAVVSNAFEFGVFREDLRPPADLGTND